RSGSVSALAQSKNIQVNFVLFGSCSPIDPGYIQIANETGGQVFVLTPAQVDQASNLPALLVGTNAVNLLAVRDTVAQSYDVPADSTMTELTSSAAPASMDVKRPNGDPVADGDADATILPLTGGKVVKISNPTVGLWSVAIGVSSAYRLDVSGSSILDLSPFRVVQNGGPAGHHSPLPLPAPPRPRL